MGGCAEDGQSTAGTFLALVGCMFRAAVCVSICALSSVASAQTTEVLHSFSGPTDGANPRGSLIQAADGDFYGTASSGGSAGLGTVFKITAAGTFTVLHHFTGGPADGAQPNASLVQGPDGSLYGTTVRGGTAELGTVFRIAASVVTVLHSFSGAPDGALPYAALIRARDGNFYGTTSAGGLGFGTIFMMTPDGTLTVKHSFTLAAEGGGPSAGLLQASDGNFYGTATYGGGSPVCCGTAFRMTADGTFTIIYHFGLMGAAYPNSALIQARD